MPTVLANDGSGSTLDADLLDGSHASAFADSSHAHSGTDITNGTVADARIASSIARDSEIVPTVLANDGSGSTLDADLLDGYHASAIMSAAGLTQIYALTSSDSVVEMDSFTVYAPGSGTLRRRLEITSRFVCCAQASEDTSNRGRIV